MAEQRRINFLNKSTDLFTSTEDIYKKDVLSVMTPLADAIEEIKIRRQDPVLISKVSDYLDGDVPEHFDQDKPICYLSRYIATPNEETVYFVEKCSLLKESFPIVIGQDIEDTFVSNNILKYNLGKLPIITGRNKHGNNTIEKITVVDFSLAQGRKLKNIITNSGIPLKDFHKNLFEHVLPNSDIKIVDESEWVSRNHRGNLLEHYKKFLSLFVAHGVMFEFYEVNEDEDFFYNVLMPAYKFVKNKFGVEPLITFLVEPDKEQEKDWNGYSKKVHSFIEIFKKEVSPVKIKV